MKTKDKGDRGREGREGPGLEPKGLKIQSKMVTYYSKEHCGWRALLLECGESQ